MGRLVFFELALFVLPFAVFAAWAWLQRPRDEEARPLFDDMPTFWLTAIGLVLMIGGLLSFATVERSAPDSVYIPSYVDENGNVVPGRTVAPDEADGS